MTAQRSTTTPLACRFAKRGCTHKDELFKPAYQRVNRARGTKILRCFPHCCPVHIPRSYCGSTIELWVDNRTALSPEHVAVYARFRQRDHPPALRIGDSVPLAAITQHLQSSATTKAPWIQSRVRTHGHGEETAMVFEINPGRRWYYTWDSSKNSATRATQHVLEAFVFLREKKNTGDGNTTILLRCVGTATSPSFKLVSFRRVSASETAQITEEVKTEALPRPPVITQALSPPQQIKDEPIESPRPYIRRPQTLTPLSSIDPLDVVFSVAQQFSMGEATSLIPSWMMRREQRQVLTLRDERQVAAHLVWWLSLDSETEAAWREHTRHGATVLLDGEALSVCYARWTRWLTSHVECWLATLKQPSIHALAGSLTARGFVPRRREYGASNSFGWRSFVAQARELFTVMALPTRATVSRMLGREPWTCPLEHVNVATLDDIKSPDSRPIRSLPVTVLFAFWQQLSTIHLDLDTTSSPHTLTIASPSAIHNETPVMRLLLDNRYRSCNAFPNGEPTASGASTDLAGFSGDYIVTPRRDGVMEITFFSWPVEPTLAAYRWRWVIRPEELWSDRLDVDLTVSVAELNALSSSKVLPTDVATWSIQQKLALVTSWRDAYTVHLPYTTTQIRTPSWY